MTHRLQSGNLAKTGTLHIIIDALVSPKPELILPKTYFRDC